MIKKNKIILFHFSRVRGLLLFALFVILPQFISLLINLIKDIPKQIKSNFLLKILNYDVLPMLLFVIIFFLIVLVILLKRKLFFSFFDRNNNWVKSFSNALLPTILYFSLAFFITYAFFVISQLLPATDFISKWMNTPNQGYIEIFDSLKNRDHFKIIFWFTYIIILAPIIEEILFRGFLQESSKRLLKNDSAIIIVNATIFSLFHMQSLSNMIFTFIVGFGLSELKVKTKKINTGIWMHGIINFTGLLYGLLMQYFNLHA